MKQFFTLAVAAMTAISVNAAQHTFVQTPVDISKGINLSACHSQLRKASKHAKAEDSSLQYFLGDFVHSQWCLDPQTYEDWIGSNCGVSILDNNDGTLTVKNVLGYGNVLATYDADEEALVIASGQQLFESRYGNVGLFAFTINDDDEAEITDEDIVCYLDDENRFEILNDGIIMVLTDGAYAGYSINALYMFNQFDRVNATMTYLDYDMDEISVGVAIDGTPDDGYIDVYGFGDVSCVALEIDGQNVNIPEGQSVFYHSDYGMFYIYPINEDCQIIDGEVTGTYDAESQSIALNDFTIKEIESNTLYDYYFSISITWLEQEDVVGIEQLAAQRSTRAFDLQGRPVSIPAHGRILVNEGQKMVVK